MFLKFNPTSTASNSVKKPSTAVTKSAKYRVPKSTDLDYDNKKVMCSDAMDDSDELQMNHCKSKIPPSDQSLASSRSSVSPEQVILKTQQELLNFYL
jgi:hypothetical protein